MRTCYAALAELGVQLALPVVTAKAVPLRFACWNPGDPLIKDAMDIAIPTSPQCWVQPQALLIPCVGFNTHRLRLGYGGGFYDRTLATAPRPIAIGVAYADALTAFDSGPHDVALDGIITEAGVF